MLLFLNPLCERLHVIASKHRNSCLGNHGSGIHVFLNVMNTATGNPDPRSEGLTNGIQSFERWKKRGMEVDQPTWIGVDQNWRDDSHPASHHHSFDISSLKG